MNKIISRRGDTDFVWSKDLDAEASTLLVYYQGEQGFSSLVAGSSLVGNKDAVCKVFSKLHQVEPMNTLPLPTYPEWKIHQLRNEDGRRYFILRISHAYTPAPEQTKAWLYNYPVMRDIVLELNEYGVDELIYLTSHVMQDFLFTEQPQIPNDELIIYDYLEPEDDVLQLTNGEVIDDLEMIVPAPSWIMCSVFNNFCDKSIRGNWLAISASDNTTYLNKNEADRLLRYLYEVHGLKHDTLYYSEMMDALKHTEHMGGNIK
jgi:hypothetical protein